MAVIFAGIFGKVTQITGYNVSDIEELIYLEEKTAIKINELLFAGILIASLGAVMDVGMSIASTLQEIYSRRPDLGMWDLFKSGMNVGKDMQAGEWRKGVFKGEKLTSNKERIYGIDVSRHQHERDGKCYPIDWDRLRITHLGTLSDKRVRGKVDYLPALEPAFRLQVQ